MVFIVSRINMAQNLVAVSQDLASNDNSMSMKEFLHFEKTCEAYTGSDEEIKLIFSEIYKLAANSKANDVLDDDVDDVELILKKTMDIALETENVLKCRPLTAMINYNSLNKSKSGAIPQIKITEPCETEKEVIECKQSSNKQVNQYAKQNAKENTEIRRKPKLRPFSAGVTDTKKRETFKIAKRLTNSSKNSMTCRHDNLVEEFKDTVERAKGLELANVQLNDDNKMLRKTLDRVTENKHVAELKLAECEKFINRLSKEFENRNTELKAIKENENKLFVELNKEQNDRKNLAIQHEKDVVVIKDLQRQVKEVEMILRRKHPDSVSALIVACKSSSLEDNKKKLLEERIARLEQEIKDKENHFQGILLTLQEKFGDMKQKYENHIIDVEKQLLEDRKINTDLKNKLIKSNITDSSTQTPRRNLRTVSTQTFIRPYRSSSAVSRLSQNSALILNKFKEDSYLVATIRGLQAELTLKQRNIAKINRETEQLRKNLRNLQKEKEALLNLNPRKKQGYKAKPPETILTRMNTEMEAKLTEIRKQKEVLVQERNTLLDSLKRTNEEFISLKKKRIQDLHTLHLAHEKELMQMNMQVYPLQEEIKLLNKTVEILQDRVRSAEDKLVKYQANINDAYAGGDNSGNVSKRDLR